MGECLARLPLLLLGNDWKVPSEKIKTQGLLPRLHSNGQGLVWQMRVKYLCLHNVC